MHSCRSLLVFLLILASSASTALAAEAFSELPASAQEAIKSVCLPVQYQEGAQAYRQCITNEVNSYSSTATAPIEALSFDDKYAVQQACTNAGAPTSATYQSCVRQQVADLNALPVPAIDDLSDDEQYALQQTCFDAQSRLGAGPYRLCINRALAELRQLPVPNVSGLSQVAQNGIQLRCSANHRNVVDYRKCLLEAVGEVTVASTAERTIVLQNPEPAVRVTTIASESTMANDTSVAPVKPEEKIATTTAVASIDERKTNEAIKTTRTLANGDQISALPSQNASVFKDNQTVALSDASKTRSKPSTNARLLDLNTEGGSVDVSSNDTNSDNDPVAGKDPSPVDLRDRATNAWLQLKSTVLALDGTNRMIVLSALALPLLLMFGWLLSRRQSDHDTDYEPVRSNSGLLDRIHPDVNTDEHEQLKRRLDAEADEVFGSIDAEGLYEDEAYNPDVTDSVAVPDDRADDFRDTREVTEPVDSRQQAVRTAATRIASKPEIAAAAATQKGFSRQGGDVPGPMAADRGAFAAWLETVDSENQLSYAIEFLIYWIAYGDERYDPALKESLFQLQNPNDRDLIKRWVLKHDVIAFRDTIHWLQENTDANQRRQIIDLLMVLLVNEHALTPVQNTLLRFLGDAFGIGNADLDIQYREAYGAAMPPLPRVDKPKWWQRQHDTASPRWDARAAANETLDVQCRIRLGLEVDGPIDEEAVVKCFRRAARRCHPDRFDALTERERELAELQFEKFEDARDHLLGVGA